MNCNSVKLEIKKGLAFLVTIFCYNIHRGPNVAVHACGGQTAANPVLKLARAAKVPRVVRTPRLPMAAMTTVASQSGVSLWQPCRTSPG